MIYFKNEKRSVTVKMKPSVYDILCAYAEADSALKYVPVSPEEFLEIMLVVNAEQNPEFRKMLETKYSLDDKPKKTKKRVTPKKSRVVDNTIEECPVYEEEEEANMPEPIQNHEEYVPIERQESPPPDYRVEQPYVPPVPVNLPNFSESLIDPVEYAVRHNMHIEMPIIAPIDMEDVDQGEW